MSAIYRREMQSYFYTPAAYVFVGVFLVLSSIFFGVTNLASRSGNLLELMAQMSYLWMLLCPILTMRLLAEEKQKKTDQLLLTSPVSLPGIVMGKYLAAVTVLLITAGMTLLFVLVVAIYGRVYPAELAVNYLGFILQGCALVALDLFLSGCAGTPVTAAVLAYGANLMLWILDEMYSLIQADWISEILKFLSLYRRNENMIRMGQLSIAAILYDLSFIAAFLALAVFRLDRKRYTR